MFDAKDLAIKAQYARVEEMKSPKKRGIPGVGERDEEP